MNWKPYLAEFLSSFILVLVALSVVSHISNGGEITKVALALGLTIITLISTWGIFSRGNINPLFSLGASVAGEQPWGQTICFWISQVLGGIAALVTASWLFFRSVNPTHVEYGNSKETDTVDFWAVTRAVLVEVVLSFIMVSAYLFSRRSGNLVNAHHHWTLQGNKTKVNQPKVE